MSRAPSAFRQRDVARVIRAAKTAGLNFVRVEVDPKTEKISLVVKGEDDRVIEVLAPVTPKKRKAKAPA